MNSPRGDISTFTTDNGANVLLASLENLNQPVIQNQEDENNMELSPMTDDEDDDDDEDADTGVGGDSSRASLAEPERGTPPEGQIDLLLIDATFAASKRLRCAAHTIQLAVQDLLSTTPVARQICRIRIEAKKARRYIAKHRCTWSSPPLNNLIR